MKICIIGGPRTGKSTLARALSLQHSYLQIYCTDIIHKVKEPNVWTIYLPEHVNMLDTAIYVANNWLTLPEFILEGHAVARALRHWIVCTGELPPVDKVYILTAPKVPQTPGQRNMHKGIATVWHQIESCFYQLTEYPDNK